MPARQVCNSLLKSLAVNGVFCLSCYVLIGIFFLMPGILLAEFTRWCFGVQTFSDINASSATATAVYSYAVLAIAFNIFIYASIDYVLQRRAGTSTAMEFSTRHPIAFVSICLTLGAMIFIPSTNAFFPHGWNQLEQKERDIQDALIHGASIEETQLRLKKSGIDNVGISYEKGAATYNVNHQSMTVLSGEVYMSGRSTQIASMPF